MGKATVEEVDCVHGFVEAWCTICKQRKGYRPGSTRHHDDCAVVAYAHATGRTYEQALEDLAANGRRNGKGTAQADLLNTLSGNGYIVWQVPTVHYAGIARLRGRYIVVAFDRSRRGHAWAIVDGDVRNAGTFPEYMTRWTAYRVLTRDEAAALIAEASDAAARDTATRRRYEHGRGV